MEKYLSLNYEETTALLEMSLFSYLNDSGGASESALAKLGELWREFCSNEGEQVEEIVISHRLSRAA